MTDEPITTVLKLGTIPAGSTIVEVDPVMDPVNSAVAYVTREGERRVLPWPITFTIAAIEGDEPEWALTDQPAQNDPSNKKG